MLNIFEDNINENYEEFRLRIKDGKSFAVTGLTSVLRLFLLSKIAKKKKTVFITATEQQALKYQTDLKNAFELDAKIVPFQNISPYETIKPNLYDYSEQVSILLNPAQILICPVKSLLEKFPTKDFFKKYV